MSQQPYIPEKLPLPMEKLKIDLLVRDLGDSTAALSRYDGILRAIPNPRILLSTLIQQEADLSSRIEGTQVSYKDVLDQEAGKIPGSLRDQDDIQEVINYRRAMITAHESLEEGRPLSLSLVRTLHQQLLESVRGEDKSPGEFRKKQNWIGAANSTIETAIFVPPSPVHLSSALENWEEYLSYDEIDPIIQTAIVHAQFELIHPFKDGNGRIGRLLIPLTLFRKNRLKTPNFYLSEILEQNRAEYYERLNNISCNNDRSDEWKNRWQGWHEWIKFFLQAVKAQAELNLIKVENILSLYNDMKKEISQATNSSYSSALIDALFIRPIFNASFIQDYLSEQNGNKVSRATVNTNLTRLVEAGIIRVSRQGSGSAPSIYAFDHLLDIVK